MPEPSLHGFLQDVFGCPADVAAEVGQSAAQRRYAARVHILKQGEQAEFTFLVLSGRAQALTYGMEGQLCLLHEFLPGDLFGAIAQAKSVPEDADIVAVEEVRVLVFKAAEFITLMEKCGAMGLAVSRMLAKRLRATAARMVERSTLSAAGRIHVELLRLARLGDGRTVKPAPVLTALAMRVHSTRETVSRTITVLERRGIVRREKDALVIVAPHRLEEMIV
jgi:CRP/FNR family transcriptional regulator, cyclic AMP receptor protein